MSIGGYKQRTLRAEMTQRSMSLLCVDSRQVHVCVLAVLQVLSLKIHAQTVSDRERNVVSHQCLCSVSVCGYMF